MHIINKSELAGLIDAGMAETEVTSVDDGKVKTTTVYSGSPFQTTAVENVNLSTITIWKIRRTIIVEEGDTSTVQNMWAEGNWDEREKLDYKYL